MLPQIHPPDSVAERNGSDYKSIDYLDVMITIRDDGVHTSVYHKVEAFPFEVILFAFTESLIPRRLGHCVFAGQVLHYLRICSHLCYAYIFLYI